VRLVARACKRGRLPRIPIRTKLAATLALPLAALVVLASIEFAELAADVDEVENQTKLATAAVGPGGLITHLQNERSFAAVEMVGSDVSLRVQVPVQGFEETRAQTDAAIASVTREIEARGPEVVTAYRPALDTLANLAAVRANIDTLRAGPDWNTERLGEQQNHMYAQYTALIRPFFDATDRVLQSVSHEELRRGAEAVNNTSRLIELFLDAARWVAVINGRQGGVDTRDEIRELTVRKVILEPLVEEIDSAPPPYDQVVARLWPRDFVGNLVTLLNRSLGREVLTAADFGPPLQTANWGGLVEFRQAMADRLTEVADDVAADARQRERVIVFAAALVLVLALALTWLVSRSITRPLRSLTAQARSMARERLPAAVDRVLATPLGEDVEVPVLAPIRVRTRDEVNDVSDALNAVQDRALNLAVGQAVLRRNVADSFVNLGRRNQNLLVRQLDLITQLENTEVDADSLASLFRLDHLATRMRRNAESLLVLAGVEPPRQWARPVSVSDVVRAALGEVEDYQRVAVREIEPATVVGSVAADLAHLLAELIENALEFSPTPEPVVVRGRGQPDGTFMLAIVDRGVGMTRDALDASNRRLSGYESFTVAPSTYLGHYVAASLAARHGIAVRLSHTDGMGGITATLLLPAELRSESVMPDLTMVGGPAAGVRGPAGPPGPPQLARTPSRPTRWEATSAPGAAPDRGAYGHARAN
jgi:signal transduction histidine kinase